MNDNKKFWVDNERITKLDYVGERKPAIICDIDGTVALMMGHRKPFEYEKCLNDWANQPVIDMVFAAKTMLEHKLTGEGEFVSVALIMLSARENVDLKEPMDIITEGNERVINNIYELTEYWLWRNMRGPLTEGYDKLFMREKGDFRKDCYVKFELYHEEIAPYYDVKYVFDDRNQVVDMWRNGCKLTCLQVADGNF